MYSYISQIIFYFDYRNKMLSYRTRAAVCAIVFATSRKMELGLGDNDLRTL